MKFLLEVVCMYVSIICLLHVTHVDSDCGKCDLLQSLLLQEMFELDMLQAKVKDMETSYTNAGIVTLIFFIKSKYVDLYTI